MRTKFTLDKELETMPIDLNDSRYEGMIVADGFDDAIIGTAFNEEQNQVFVYSVEKALKILRDDQHMDRHEAQEYFDFNVEGSYAGLGGPIWMHDIEDDA